MNKAIAYAHSFSNDGMWMRRVELEELAVVTYGDSGFANATGCKTQQCHVTVFTNRSCAFRTIPASIIDWRSGRAHRVVRRSLVGEASACDQAADSAVYTARFVEGVVSGRAAKKDRSKSTNKLPIFICTEATSLYDSLKQQTPSLSEKRATIDIMSIKEAVSETNRNIMWVPTEEMKADGLTKFSVALAVILRGWCMLPVVCSDANMKNRYDVFFGAHVSKDIFIQENIWSQTIIADSGRSNSVSHQFPLILL